MTGVSLEVFGGVLRVLADRHGSRLASAAEVNAMLPHLAEVERLYLSLPPDPAPRVGREDDGEPD